METLDLLLEAGQFQEAVTRALTDILPEKRPSFPKAGWDRLTRPGYSLTVNNVTVKGCPFLLGCLQAVNSEGANVPEEWYESLALAPVVSFLKQGEPLPDWYYVQAVLACGKAATAARCNDHEGLLQQGYCAARWFRGTAPEHLSEQELTLGKSVPFAGKNPIRDCFAALAESRQIPIGQARDLTQWFLSPAQNHEPLRIQRIMIPYYENNGGAVTTLEMELLPGRGEFYADPVVMAFIHWDALFRGAYENAWAYIHQLGCWRDDVDVCWRLHADPPISPLLGGSAGGAFFVDLWHLLTGTLSDLSVTISTEITADGRVSFVNHIIEKIHAVLQVPALWGIIVAENQKEVQAGPYDRLQIWKVQHAADPERHACHSARE